MSWMQTRTGKIVNLSSPTPDMIDPYDICYHLSYLCRFNGAVRHFYSVAQHSVEVLHIMPTSNRRLLLLALLHDAAEAYVGDLLSPLKRMLPGFKEIEDRVQDAVFQRYGLHPPTPEEHALIRIADHSMLLTEKRDLLVYGAEDWSEWVVAEAKPREQAVIALGIQEAQARFTKWHDDLWSDPQCL